MKAHLLLAVFPALSGLGACGTNKFEKEVEAERSAVTLARQTLEGDYDLITAAELSDAITKGEPLLLIDAMPLEESFEKEHLPGARNFPFPKAPVQDWDATEAGGKTVEDYEALLGPDKERSIVVYCGFVACARSHNGAVWAKKLGYKNVWRFPGGIHAWKGAGHETETGGG